MNSFFLHFLSLPTIARLNRRLAGLALLWLLTLLLLNPAGAQSSTSESKPSPAPVTTQIASTTAANPISAN